MLVESLLLPLIILPNWPRLIWKRPPVLLSRGPVVPFSNFLECTLEFQHCGCINPNHFVLLIIDSHITIMNFSDQILWFYLKKDNFLVSVLCQHSFLPSLIIFWFWFIMTKNYLHIYVMTTKNYLDVFLCVISLSGSAGNWDYKHSCPEFIWKFRICKR